MTAARPTVMHVITGLGVGGAENMLAALVAAGGPSAPRHVVVDLLSGGANADRIRAAGVALHALALRRGRPNFGAVGRLARLIADARPDVLQSWMYHADVAATLAWLRSARRRRTRLYWGVRCSDMDVGRYGLFLRATIFTAARLSRLPTAVIANSEAGRRVHEALGYRPKRFLVIDNGVDVDRYRPDPVARRTIRDELGIPREAPVILLPARRDPMKDHETFLAAIDLMPEVTALAAGAETQSLPERPNLRALGPRDDLHRIYPAADVVLSTSAFGEGFSNAIAEGMACGVPAVATDVGDARRIVGETGLIVPPRDPAALAAAVREVLASAPANRGRRARERVCAHFTLERFVSAFSDLYCETA